jgi:hypothetical protein
MSDTKTYKVLLCGCDNSNKVEIDLTEDQAATVRELARRLTAASQNNNQPQMYVEQRFVGVRASGGGA